MMWDVGENGQRGQATTRFPAPQVNANVIPGYPVTSYQPAPLPKPRPHHSESRQHNPQTHHHVVDSHEDYQLYKFPEPQTDHNHRSRAIHIHISRHAHKSKERHGSRPRPSPSPNPDHPHIAHSHPPPFPKPVHRPDHPHIAYSHPPSFPEPVHHSRPPVIAHTQSAPHTHHHSRPPPSPIHHSHSTPQTHQIQHHFKPPPSPNPIHHSHPKPSTHHYSRPPPSPRPPHQSHVAVPSHPAHNSSNQPHPAPLDTTFQYSRCTGRKKALCIGINYRGQPNELRGCINDAKHVRDFLIKHHGYKERDIMLLTDESSRYSKLPTRENIIAGMRWLVQSAGTNDSLFFHYSGHGGQTPDLDGDEIDGQDEVIFPLDFKQRGHIIDDEMHRIMVKPLPAGCRLTALFDSCHSGTVLDLPYIYSSHGRLKGSHIKSSARARLATPADVISWSGCKDGQTSADTFAGGVAVGAMSYAFITSLTTQPRQSYQELLRSIRLILNPRYSQKPQLGSSHHIDTSLRFIL